MSIRLRIRRFFRHAVFFATFGWACLTVITIVPVAMAAQTYGQSLDWLYQVDQYVADQGERTRLEAAQRSLLTVLSRTSGLASVPRGAIISQALKNPARYYTKYVYFNPMDTDADRRNLIDKGAVDTSTDLAVRFDFQAAAIKQLARDAKLPIWWSRRPLTMVWMVLDEPNGRAVVEHGAESVRNELDAAANRRGLPTLLPMMDLQDSVLVNPGVIWGKFTDVLDQASQRYLASQYLVGRFSVQKILGERLYTGEWMIRSEKGESSQFVRGLDLEGIAKLGIDMAAQSVLDQHLVFAATPRLHDVLVRDVADIGAYAELMQYLESLEFVDEVMLLGLQQQTLTLRLQTVATDQQLQTLLMDDGLFEYRPVLPELALPELATNLEFIWRGKQ